MGNVQNLKMRKSIVAIGVILCSLIIFWSGLLYNSISELKEVVIIDNHLIMIQYILGVILLGVTLSWTIFFKMQLYIFSSIGKIISLALFYIFSWILSAILFMTLLRNIIISIA